MPLAPACLPRLINVTDSRGCTLTNASIRGLTPNEFEAFQNKEIDLARMIANSAEAKALGVQERGLATLLRSSIKDIKPAIQEKRIDEQSLILPYIQRRQRSVINANFFAIESGAATPGAGTGDIPASAWNIVVNLGSSPWQTPLKALERYFQPGKAMYVITWKSAANKTSLQLHFTVLAAVAAAGDKATVTIVPNVSASAWALLTAPQKADYQPTFGVVQLGVNNVNDRESWCHNQPDDKSLKLIVNWLQTSRTSRAVTDSYRKTLDAILSGKVNEFQRTFQYNSIVEQNKRAAQLDDDEFLRSVWYNDVINEQQTAETYDQLPPVGDIEEPGAVHGYKANALGFLRMLTDCGRIVDNQAAALDLNVIFTELYNIKRNREADGNSISVVDSLTDRLSAGMIRDVMIRYYKVRYGVEIVRYAKLGEKITNEGQVLFNYDIYDIPDAGVQWAVFWDPFFDDILAATPDGTGTTPAGFKARARGLWFLDWSDISIGLGKTNSVTRKSPDAATSSAYKCVITPNVTEYNLRSYQWTCMLDRPARHWMVQNFSNECPVINVSNCPVPNP